MLSKSELKDFSNRLFEHKVSKDCKPIVLSAGDISDSIDVCFEAVIYINGEEVRGLVTGVFKGV